MPTYEVEIPGSGKYSVESPTDLTDKQAYFAVMQQLELEKPQAPAPVAPVTPQKRAEDVGFFEGIGAAGRRGIESLGDVASGLGLAGTALTGTDEETRRKMQAIRAEQMKPQETPGTTFADLERIYKEKGLMSALGEVPKYASEQILQSAPQMAAPLAAGAAASPFLTPVGGALVGMGVYGIQQFGNFLVRQAVEKEDPKELEVAKAALTAAGTAPIGYFADRFTVGLGSLGKTAGKEVMEELAKRSGMDLAAGVTKQVGKGAVSGIIAEAPTEVLEQAAERYQAGLSLSDPDAMNEYKEAFFGAAAAGGGMKGVSTGLDLRSGIREARAPKAEEIPPNLLPPETLEEKPIVGEPSEGNLIKDIEQQYPPIGTTKEDVVTPEPIVQQPTPVEPTPAPPPIQKPVEPVAPIEPQIQRPLEPIAPIEPIVQNEVAPIEPIKSNWPEDIPKDLFRGHGRANKGEAYGPMSSGVPILGKAKYFAFDQDTASTFGPNIETATAPLNNPYVIRDGDQWRKLTKEAGWPVANPSSLPADKVEQLTDNMQTLLKDRGYDGMIVYWDNKSPYDIGPRGENYKTLNSVFGVPQAVVFGEPATQKKAPVEAPFETRHQIEIDKEEGNIPSFRKSVSDAESKGILYKFNLDNKIDLRRSKVDWGVMAKMRKADRLLNHIRDYVPLDTRQIIDRIAPYVKDIPISLNNADVNNPRSRYYGYAGVMNSIGSGDRAVHKVQFFKNSDWGNSFEIITHELIHGATVRNYYEGRNGNKKFEAASKELDKLAEYLVKNNSKDIPFFSWYKKEYINKNGQFKSSHEEQRYLRSVAVELLSWGTVDRKTQEALKKIKLPDGISAWSKFVDTMRKLLGLPEGETNALIKIIDLQESLIGGETAKPWPSRGRSTIRGGLEPSTVNEQEAPEEIAGIAPRQRAMGGPAPEATWELQQREDGTPLSQFTNNRIYEYVDKFVDLKDIINAINTSVKTGKKKLDETWNAYRRETLYHNRVAFMTNSFLKNDLKPLAEDMVKRNISEEELNNYLLARHAEDYNLQINERNKDAVHLQNRGSGVESRIANAYMKGASKQEVDAIRNAFKLDGIELNKNEEALLKDLATMTDAKRRNLEEVAKRVDNIVKGTQKIAVAGGLEKQATVDYWNDIYPNYVPLKRNADELDFVEKNYGAGRGFSTKSGFGRAATGSLKTVDNIMANLILQRDMAIVRAEKGRIGRALYAMALQNPNPAFWLPVNPEASVISKANDLGMQIAKTKDKLKAKIAKVDADIAAGRDMDEADLKEIDDIRKKLSKDIDRHKDLSAQADIAKQNMIKELKKFDPAAELDPAVLENLIREPQGAWYNPATGLVEYKTNAYLRSSPNVLAIPVDGETRYIFFNPGDSRAKRLVNSLKSADVEQMGQITSTVGKFTRYIAQVNTQFNPFFGIINMLRDVQGAQLNLSSTALAGKQMAVNSHIPGAMTTIYRSLRSERYGGQPMGKYAADWKEFEERGGPTGIKDMLAREQDKMSVLAEEISKLKENPTKKGGRKALETVFGLMSDFNDVMENSVRLSAFIEAKQKFAEQEAKRIGVSPEDILRVSKRIALEGQANVLKTEDRKLVSVAETVSDRSAELAKNLTVNFNRKGAKSQFVNSWFAFFNAAVQGSARLAETLKGPAGKKIISSLIGMGVMQQFMLASAGFSDDDPPEFVRARNLIFPTADGKYISFPMPLGFNALVNTGRIATAAFMDGGKHPAKYLEDFAGSISDSFNPLGSSGLSMQTLAPTIADPMLAIEANKDAFGRPIYREDRANKPTPGYLRSSEGSNAVSRGIAEFLNRISGGTEFQKGAISPTADEIDYLAGQLGGGTYREAKKVVEYAKSKAEGEEVAPYKVPLAGRFMGDTGSEANARSRFYQNVTQLSKYEDEIKGRATHHQDVQAFLKEHPEARLYDAANSVENEIIQMNKLRKEMVERGASKEQLKRLNDMKIQRMRQFNALVEKASQP